MITKAIILAAGRGERLWPYNATNAKAALSIGTRPLVQWQLDSLSETGVKKVCIVVGLLEGMVRNACATWERANPEKMEISFTEQKVPTGTADAALLGIQSLGCHDEPVYAIPGDLYFQVEDLQLLEKSVQSSCISALVAPVSKRDVQECVRVEIENDKIVEVRAHSREYSTKSRKLTGLMALPSDFSSVLSSTPDIPTCVEIGGMAPIDRTLAESLHQSIVLGLEVLPAEATQPIVDIDKPWDLLEANRLSAIIQTKNLTEHDLSEGSSIDSSARIEGSVRLGKGSKIGPGVIVYGNLVVGENSFITDGAFVEDSVVVGDGCQIWRGALIGKQSVIGHGCNVGHGAEFEGLMLPESYSYHYGEFWGILGRCSDLGAATVCGTLRFDDGETPHRVKGRKEIPRYHSNATYLGDYVRTGVNAILMPGVKVGPYSLIGAGVLLGEDVPNNTSVFLEQSQKRGSWGPERYGW